tara:strand:+ start:269 stop:586 length:318 start_codon:yes stop_codon:yes gene_type:complete
MTSNFWVYNRNILLDRTEFLNFIPLLNMSKEEKLNAITRFSFYLSVILSVLSNNLHYILIFISTLIFTYLFYIFTDVSEELPEELQEDLKDIDISDVPVDISNLI